MITSSNTRFTSGRVLNLITVVFSVYNSAIYSLSKAEIEQNTAAIV